VRRESYTSPVASGKSAEDGSESSGHKRNRRACRASASRQNLSASVVRGSRGGQRDQRALIHARAREITASRSGMLAAAISNCSFVSLSNSPSA
jgi:hypothetical protein